MLAFVVASVLGIVWFLGWLGAISVIGSLVTDDKTRNIAALIRGSEARR